MKIISRFISFSIVYTISINIAMADDITVSPVSYSANFMQMILGLCSIVFMIVSIVWLMKKIGYKGYGSSGVIKIKSCLPISSKEKLLLIEVGEEQILIGTAPGFIGHLKTIQNPIVDTNNTSVSPMTSAFSEKLNSFLDKGMQRKEGMANKEMAE